MKRITENWLDSAKLDLDNIEMIIHREDLTPISAFHAQQAVEKSLKTFLEEKEIAFRKIHDVITLYGMLSDDLPALDMAILERLNDLYIDSRYPGELGLLPDGKPSVDDATKFHEFALSVFEKIQKIVAND